MKYIKSFKFWIAFLILAYTFAGFIMIPWFITDKLPGILKNKIGLNISVKRAHFNPYTFEITLNNITIKDLDEKPAFSLKKLYINYTILGLLDKTFLFSDIYINSPKLYATIKKDGKLNLNNLLVKSNSIKQKTTSKKRSIPSIILRKIVMENGQIVIKDKRENKNFNTTFGPYRFTAHDISTNKGELNAYTFKTLINKESKLSWKGGMSIDPLKLYGKIEIKSLKLPKLYKYILPNIHASLESGSVSIDIPYQINLEKDLRLSINKAQVKIKNLKFKNKKNQENLGNISDVSLSDFNLRWPKQSISIGLLKIANTNIFPKLEKNGNINLVKAFTINSKTDAKIQDSKKSKAWSYLVKKIDIDNTNIAFENLNIQKTTKTNFSQISLHVENISSNKKSPITFQISSILNKKSNIKLSGSAIQKPLNINSHVELSNILPNEFIGYINPYINFNLKSANINIAADINASLDTNMSITLKANSSIDNLAIDAKNGNKLLKWDKLNISGLNIQWPKQSVLINKTTLNQAFINIQLEENGKTNLLKAFMPVRQQNKKHKSAKSAKPWKFLIKVANIDKSSFLFLDKGQTVPTKYDLSSLSLHVQNISSDKKSPISYKLTSKLNRKTDINLAGKILQKPLSLSSEMDLKNIQVDDFKNYYSSYINFKIKNASININGNLKANLEKKPKIKMTMNTSINGVKIYSQNNQKLLQWKKLLVKGINFKNTPLSIAIKSVKLDKPYIRAHIAKNRTTNFSNLIKSNAKKRTPKHNKKTAKSPSIKLKIGDIKLTNGTTDFSDNSLPFPFHTKIHNLNGYISALNFNSTTPSKIKLNGKIDRYGYADIKGILLPFKIKQKADITVLLKNMNLSSLTPYSGKFLGYKIANGKLSMDLNYKITKSSLIGKNKINIDRLDLGDSVKSKDAVNLPLKLALALLKDSNNQIDINLPVSGDMNNPDFSYGSIVWKAIGNMITGIVTAPFKFLGSLLGIKGDDLKSIDFDKGSAKIISTEIEKLENLNKIMTKRPKIKLEIIGSYDKIFDTKELQKHAFEIVINKVLEKSKKDSNKTAIDNYGKALKLLYTKKFTVSKYEKLKQTFIIKPKVDDNKTKKSKKVKLEAKLDLVAFNAKMQEELTDTIKIPNIKLVTLANERAKNIKDILVQKYKIDGKRLKILHSKESKAKSDRWVQCELKISI